MARGGWCFASALILSVAQVVPAVGELVPSAEPDVPVTATDLRVSAAQNSSALVASPKDPRLVVAAHRVDFPAYGCGIHVSGNGGRSWVPAALPALPAGAAECFGPEVGFDRRGTLYFLFVGLHTAGHVPMGVFLATSEDRGRTFGRPRLVIGPNAFGVRMAIDQGAGRRGRIHLAWVQAREGPGVGAFPAPPNPVVSSFSDDGGRSFSRPVEVSDPGRELVVAPALAVGGDGAVHVLYYDLGGDQRDYRGLEGPVWEGEWSLVLASSAGGGRFGRGLAVEEHVVPPERPNLVLTMPPASLVARRNRMYVAWPDARRGDPDVFVRASADGGRTWAEARRVNDDPAGNGASQALPRIAVAPGGRLDVAFLDRRDDPHNLRNHTYFTWSVDAGRTFGANLRLSRESGHSLVGARYAVNSARGRAELGARLALLSYDPAALVAWIDNRNSPFVGDALTGPTVQDVYATTVWFSTPPARPGAA